MKKFLFVVLLTGCSTVVNKPNYPDTTGAVRDVLSDKPIQLDKSIKILSDKVLENENNECLYPFDIMDQPVFIKCKIFLRRALEKRIELNIKRGNTLQVMRDKVKLKILGE